MLLDRSPLTKKIALPDSFDLHFSGTPQAFVLSQDQTLHQNLAYGGEPRTKRPDPPTESFECECPRYSRSSRELARTLLARSPRRPARTGGGVIHLLDFEIDESSPHLFLYLYSPKDEPRKVTPKMLLLSPVVKVLVLPFFSAPFHRAFI